MPKTVPVLRRIGGVLAMALPLATAAVFVAAFARDALELASAAIAVGTTLSLASLVQLAGLRRESALSRERQDETRAQALALARCMKALNARLSDLEQGCGGAAQAKQTPSSPALLTQVEPPAYFIPGGTERWGHECGLPAAPEQSADRRLAMAILDAATSRGEGCVLVRSPENPAATPRALALVGALVAADPEFAARFRLGLRQSALRTPGEAEALARLAQAGVRMALTDVTDFRLDPHALKACNIISVVLGPDAAPPPDSLRTLRQAGMDVVVGPGQPHASFGEAIVPAIIPWRAAPDQETRRGIVSRLRRPGAGGRVIGERTPGDGERIVPALRESA